MARHVVTKVVCDSCENVIEGDPAVMRVSYDNITKAADLCRPCATSLPGTEQKRRGRKPGTTKKKQQDAPAAAPDRVRPPEAPTPVAA